MSMRLAVATTKTGSRFSCIHVSSVPTTRAVVPPSERSELPMPARPFSISSIHSTQGASAWATWSAVRMLPSDWPTMPPKTLPMSKRSRGNCQEDAIALATRLLPQPCTPRSRSPLGASRPKSRAPGS